MSDLARKYTVRAVASTYMACLALAGAATVLDLTPWGYWKTFFAAFSTLAAVSIVARSWTIGRVFAEREMQ